MYSIVFCASLMSSLTLCMASSTPNKPLSPRRTTVGASDACSSHTLASSFQLFKVVSAASTSRRLDSLIVLEEANSRSASVAASRRSFSILLTSSDNSSGSGTPCAPRNAASRRSFLEFKMEVKASCFAAISSRFKRIFTCVSPALAASSCSLLNAWSCLSMDSISFSISVISAFPSPANSTSLDRLLKISFASCSFFLYSSMATTVADCVKSFVIASMFARNSSLSFCLSRIFSSPRFIFMSTLTMALVASACAFCLFSRAFFAASCNTCKRSPNAFRKSFIVLSLSDLDGRCVLFLALSFCVASTISLSSSSSSSSSSPSSLMFKMALQIAWPISAFSLATSFACSTRFSNRFTCCSASACNLPTF
mmetsp:Transcript_5459/g.18481  ORF Transcript_5459/g.18481 Transcript_5459/m.18481 type:complete len:368 (-) Transcript_5459:1804-2907(-)